VTIRQFIISADSKKDTQISLQLDRKAVDKLKRDQGMVFNAESLRNALYCLIPAPMKISVDQ